jgi:protein-tyrosine phosphatase
MKILMVCLGNICRSPLAEGIMKNKIETLGLPWQVDSAGTGNYHAGELPDRRSIAVAKKYGIDITYQRARQFQIDDYHNFDLILVMDKSNYKNVILLAQNESDKKKVSLILDFSDSALDEVPDPYWDDNGFEAVYQMLDVLDEACEQILLKYNN